MYINFKDKKYKNKELLYQYLYDRFEPFKKDLLREITDDDLERLTQIPMIRITNFGFAIRISCKIEHSTLFVLGYQFVFFYRG